MNKTNKNQVFFIYFLFIFYFSFYFWNKLRSSDEDVLRSLCIGIGSLGFVSNVIKLISKSRVSIYKITKLICSKSCFCYFLTIDKYFIFIFLKMSRHRSYTTVVGSWRHKKDIMSNFTFKSGRKEVLNRS